MFYFILYYIICVESTWGGSGWDQGSFLVCPKMKDLIKLLSLSCVSWMYMIIWKCLHTFSFCVSFVVIFCVDIGCHIWWYYGTCRSADAQCSGTTCQEDNSRLHKPQQLPAAVKIFWTCSADQKNWWWSHLHRVSVMKNVANGWSRVLNRNIERAYFCVHKMILHRSLWLCSQRRRSAAPRLLRLWVWIQLRAWMLASCVCYVV